MSYKVEIVEREDPVEQLEESKLSIKDLFSNLLNETKGYWLLITVKVLLKEYKVSGEIEFAPVYFNSTTKTIINYRFKLENSFQEILYMIDAWISEGSGWSVEPIESQYINISTYRLTIIRKFLHELTYWIKKSKKRTNQHQKQRSKMFFMVSC